MYEFTKQENQILQNIGESPSGKNFLMLLQKIKIKIADVDNVESGPNMAAELEGRKIAKKFITKLCDTISKKPTYGGKEENGSDDFE